MSVRAHPTVNVAGCRTELSHSWGPPTPLCFGPRTVPVHSRSPGPMTPCFPAPPSRLRSDHRLLSPNFWDTVPPHKTSISMTRNRRRPRKCFEARLCEPQLGRSVELRSIATFLVCAHALRVRDPRSDRVAALSRGESSEDFCSFRGISCLGPNKKTKTASLLLLLPCGRRGPGRGGAPPSPPSEARTPPSPTLPRSTLAGRGRNAANTLNKYPASRPCESCNQHTGETPVPLPRG